MDRSDLLLFMRLQRWAVQASVGERLAPQAAVIGVAVTDALELVFDTLEGARKAANLRKNPNIALVIGWDDAQTVQYEGVADEPRRAELARLKEAYFTKFPTGVEREDWAGITYFRVRPRWVRYSDFRADEPVVVTFDEDTLRHWAEAALLDVEHARFLTSLERCELSGAEFNHLAHVRAAWAYTSAHGADLGGERFDAALRRFANHLGAHQKYHATMTRALLRILASRMHGDARTSWEAFQRDNEDVLRSARALLDSHYTRRLLDSPEAKARFVLPDRLPLPESSGEDDPEA